MTSHARDALHGTEWIVDASGCDDAPLRSLPTLQSILDDLARDLGLHRVGEPVWHVFGGEAGITGLVLLSESHMTCHTFPEHGFATFNLYSCTPRAAWPWEARLRERLGAERVRVRELLRGDPTGPLETSVVDEASHEHDVRPASPRHERSAGATTR